MYMYTHTYTFICIYMFYFRAIFITRLRSFTWTVVSYSSAGLAQLQKNEQKSTVRSFVILLVSINFRKSAKCLIL